MKRLELLSPAKDLRSARAAIDCGADAVYMGGPKLGARAAAANSLADIAEAARYAHLYGARLYVTLNTIVYEKELKEAEELARGAVKAGADALIVQDLAYTRMDLGDVELHASTQMCNVSPEWATFLGRCGFSRIILERSLTKEQIAAVCRATDADAEAFVHGAVCVCRSGRCYMSRAFSARSGNRGECSQPCRLTYDLLDSEMNPVLNRKHLLSVNDLDLSGRLGELVDAGVTSFKIEGRLKDEAYVRNVTALYSTLLNRVIADRNDCERSSHPDVELNFTPQSSKTFTRAGGEYFFDGFGRGVASFDTPKAMGERLGKVGSVGPKGFRLDSAAELGAGDGICFFSDGELHGTSVNSFDGRTVTPNKTDLIRVGTEIYRNFDKRFIDAVLSGAARRTVPIKLCLRYSAAGIVLTAKARDEAVECKVEGPFEAARDSGKAVENLRVGISKCGGTPFEAREVDVSGEGDVPFVAASVINSLRREALERLAAKLSDRKPVHKIAAEDKSARSPYAEIDGRFNVVNSLAERFFADHGARVTERGYDLRDDMAGVEVMTTPYCLRREAGECLKEGSKLTGPLYLRHGDAKFRLDFLCKECIMKIVKI